MSRAARIANVAAVFVPLAGVIAATVLLWGAAVSARDLILFGAMYLLTGFGVTVGFHRLLTHRSFQAVKPLEYAFAVLGSMAVQGPVITWVADHRKHHANADADGDPHSPHVGHDGGVRGVLAGLWHAHVGWLFREHGVASRRRHAPDLLDDRGIRAIDRLFPAIVLVGLLIPAALGYVAGGTVGAAATGLLWGGLVRIFFIHHVTWSVNSVCHFLGSRRFDTDDRSTNVPWLAIPSLGEAWHHNHHAFPRSASHGLRRRETDLSGLLIAGLSKIGLARGVVSIPPDRQRQRLAVPTPEDRGDR